MHTCAYACVCICVCMYVCIGACVYVCTCMYVCLVYVCIYIYIRARVGVHMHSCRRILFCSWLALVTGVGGYVLAGVEKGVLSCIFLYFCGC